MIGKDLWFSSLDEWSSFLLSSTTSCVSFPVCILYPVQLSWYLIKLNQGVKSSKSYYNSKPSFFPLQVVMCSKYVDTDVHVYIIHMYSMHDLLQYTGYSIKVS